MCSTWNARVTPPSIEDEVARFSTLFRTMGPGFSMRVLMHPLDLEDLLKAPESPRARFGGDFVVIVSEFVPRGRILPAPTWLR